MENFWSRRWFPSGSGNLPTGSGSFPSGSGSFPTGSGSFPTDSGKFSNGLRQVFQRAQAVFMQAQSRKYDCVPAPVLLFLTVRYILTVRFWKNIPAKKDMPCCRLLLFRLCQAPLYGVHGYDSCLMRDKIKSIPAQRFIPAQRSITTQNPSQHKDPARRRIFVLQQRKDPRL